MKSYVSFSLGLLLTCLLPNVYGQQNASIADGFVISSINVNGQTSPPSSSVTAGQSFSVSFNYQIWDRTNSSAVWYISAGIDTMPQVVAYGPSLPGFYPGASGTANVNLTAPNTNGTYQIRVCASPSTSQSLAFQNYRNVYASLAYQAGAIGKITVGGSSTSLHPVFYSWGYSLSGTSSISFTTSYQLWDNSNPSAIWYVIAALDSMPQQVVYSGIPGTSPGVTTNNATVTLTNYGSQKVRQVYLWAIPAVNQSTAFANYRSGWVNGRSQAGSAKQAIITAVELQNNSLPSDLSLSQNYPNPFNPTTAFDYTLTRRGKVLVQIFNSLGQHIATLFDGQRDAGTYHVDWNGRFTSGSTVPSGSYFYQLTVDNKMMTKKMILIK